MDDRKRRTVSREVRPVGKKKQAASRRTADPAAGRKTVRTPEQPRTSERTQQRRRVRTEEKAAMKIKERKVSPTPVKRKRTPSKPEDYAHNEQPRKVEPGKTVHKTDSTRRKEKFERYRRRRRIFMVTGFVLFFAALTAGVIFGAKVLFQIDTITVTGETRYSADEIRTAAGITTEDNLLLVNTGRSASAVDALFPYLGKVEVRRHLPDTVEIYVEEAVATRAFDIGGRYLLVSDAGRILEVSNTLPEGMFCVKGLQLESTEPAKQIVIQDETAAEAYQEISATLAEENFTGINSIDFTDVYDITMLYDGRITMRLGSPSNLAYKIRFGMRIVTGADGDGLDKNDRGVLDLSLVRANNKAYFTNESAVSQTPGTSSSSSSDSSSQPDSSQDESLTTSSEPEGGGTTHEPDEETSSVLEESETSEDTSSDLWEETTSESEPDVSEEEPDV